MMDQKEASRLQSSTTITIVVTRMDTMWQKIIIAEIADFQEQIMVMRKNYILVTIQLQEQAKKTRNSRNGWIKPSPEGVGRRINPK